MSIDVDLAEQIKERLDILTALRNYTNADVSMLRGRKGHIICPFHNEKSPSFYVNTEKNTYTCYGCGKHGDVINLYSEVYGWNNKDAIKTLAAELGIIKNGVQPLNTEKKKELSKKIQLKNDIKEIKNVAKNTYRKLCELHHVMKEFTFKAKSFEDLEKIDFMIQKTPEIEYLLDCLLNRNGDKEYINALIKAKKIVDNWEK